MRLNNAAGKLATSLRGELSNEAAIDALLKKPGDLEAKLLEYEHEVIKRALQQANGSVTNAGKLLGITYQGLTYILNTRHEDLLKLRSPVHRRRSRKAGRRHPRKQDKLKWKTVLICAHNAPHLAVKLRSADEPHHCPHVTANCNCEPIEATKTEYENALRGEWSDRIFELCKNQRLES